MARSPGARFADGAEAVSAGGGGHRGRTEEIELIGFAVVGFVQKSVWCQLDGGRVSTSDFLRARPTDLKAYNEHPLE
jgi:hypothetical protein